MTRAAKVQSGDLRQIASVTHAQSSTLWSDFKINRPSLFKGRACSALYLAFIANGGLTGGNQNCSDELLQLGTEFAFRVPGLLEIPKISVEELCYIRRIWEREDEFYIHNILGRALGFEPEAAAPAVFVAPIWEADKAISLKERIPCKVLEGAIVSLTTGAHSSVVSGGDNPTGKWVIYARLEPEDRVYVPATYHVNKHENVSASTEFDNDATSGYTICLGAYNSAGFTDTEQDKLYVDNEPQFDDDATLLDIHIRQAIGGGLDAQRRNAAASADAIVTAFGGDKVRKYVLSGREGDKAEGLIRLEPGSNRTLFSITRKPANLTIMKKYGQRLGVKLNSNAFSHPSEFGEDKTYKQNSLMPVFTGLTN